MRTGTVFADPAPRLHEFLLAALHPSPERLASFRRDDAARIDWERLLAVTDRNKVSGLFVGRMDDIGFEEWVPPETLRRFEEVRALGLRAANRYAQTLAEARALLDGAGVPFFVTKGAGLATRLYGDPIHRPSYDVDLVVPRRFLERADRLLLGIGYQMMKPRARHVLFAPLSIRRSLRGGGKLPPERAREVYLEHHYHFPLVLPPADKRLPIDLHWQLTHERVWSADEEAIWAEAEPATSEAPATLGREASLVYLAVHTFEQGVEGVKLRDFVDLAWAMSSRRTSGDPARVIEIAARWNVGDHLRAAAETTEALFPGVTGDFLEASGGDGWAIRCFRRAGFPDLLWELGEPETKLRRLTRRLLRQAFWDAGLRRPPRAAGRTLAAYLVGAKAPPREKSL